VICNSPFMVGIVYLTNKQAGRLAS